MSESVNIEGAKVLLVEDNVVNQVVATRLLTKIGCKVEIAENGRIALEKIAQSKPVYDLVLMDCQMPNVDGYKATMSIRRFEEKQSLPRVTIVGLSAHALQEYRQKALDAGMDDYLTKPVRSQDLQGLFEKLSLVSAKGEAK